MDAPRSAASSPSRPCRWPSRSSRRSSAWRCSSARNPPSRSPRWGEDRRAGPARAGAEQRDQGAGHRRPRPAGEPAAHRRHLHHRPLPLPLPDPGALPPGAPDAALHRGGLHRQPAPQAQKRRARRHHHRSALHRDRRAHQAALRGGLRGATAGRPPLGGTREHRQGGPAGGAPAAARRGTLLPRPDPRGLPGDQPPAQQSLQHPHRRGRVAGDHPPHGGLEARHHRAARLGHRHRALRERHADQPPLHRPVALAHRGDRLARQLPRPRAIDAVTDAIAHCRQVELAPA